MTNTQKEQVAQKYDPAEAQRAQKGCCEKCFRTYPVSEEYKNDPDKGWYCMSHACECHTPSESKGVENTNFMQIIECKCECHNSNLQLCSMCCHHHGYLWHEQHKKELTTHRTQLLQEIEGEVTTGVISHRKQGLDSTTTNTPAEAKES